MTELVLVLTPIALLDSTSIVPLAIVVLVILLGGPSPLIRSAALLAGIFVTYLACGVLILFGLQSVFDAVNTYALRVWQEPHTEELIFQILIGLVLGALGLRKALKREEKSREGGPRGYDGRPGLPRRRRDDHRRPAGSRPLSRGDRPHPPE